MELRPRLSLGVILAVYAVGLLVSVPWDGPVAHDAALRHYVLLGDYTFLLENVRLLEISPPGWHLVAFPLLNLTGLDPALVLRALNVLLVLAAIVAAYVTASTIHEPWTGLLAAAIVPANFTFLSLISRADLYVLYTVSVVLLAMTSVKAVSVDVRARPAWLAAYAAAATVTAFVHYVGFVIVGSFALAGLYVRLDDWRAMARWVAAHTPIALGYVLWSPILLFHIEQTQHFGSPSTPILGLAQAVTPMTVYPDQNPVLMVVLGVHALLLALLVAFTALSVFRSRVDRGGQVLVGGVAIAGMILVLKDVFMRASSIRYAAPLALLLALVVCIALGFGYDRISGRFPASRRRTIAAVLVLLVVAPFAAAAVNGLVVGETIRDNGDLNHNRWERSQERAANLEGAADRTDELVAEAPDRTAVLATVHASEAALAYYNARSYPIHGVPVDAVEDHRMQVQVHTQDVYDPQSPAHRERLDELVDGKDRVVVYLSHADNSRYHTVRAALEERGFEVTETYGTPSAGLALFERTG